MQMQMMQTDERETVSETHDVDNNDDDDDAVSQQQQFRLR